MSGLENGKAVLITQWRSLMASLASPEEVDAFLAEHEFIGYQEIPLPHGKSVPGKRHDRRLEQILGRVSGLIVGQRFDMWHQKTPYRYQPLV